MLQVGLPQALVRRKAAFWVNHGLLLESSSPSAGPSSTPAAQRQGGAAAASGPEGGGRRRPNGRARGVEGRGMQVYRRATRLDPALHGEPVVGR